MRRMRRISPVLKFLHRDVPTTPFEKYYYTYDLRVRLNYYVGNRRLLVFPNRRATSRKSLFITLDTIF